MDDTTDTNRYEAPALNTGQVIWLGARSPRTARGSQAPTQSGPLVSLDQVIINGSGVVGDRYRRGGGERAVTLIQFEHFAVVSALLGGARVAAELVRRNIVVKSINLQSLKRGEFALGDSRLWRHRSRR